MRNRKISCFFFYEEELCYVWYNMNSDVGENNEHRSKSSII